MPEGGKGENDRKKLMVLVTSVDGHVKHPFDRDDALSEVHRFAYDRIVKQREAVPFERTWLEHEGQRLDDSELVGSLVDEEQRGGDPDLTLSLSWATGGGICSGG